ncbi:MAG: hypothetical protein GY856_16330 [bacterium]|nr:hypothetical protein [bacterium]
MRFRKRVSGATRPRKLAVGGLVVLALSMAAWAALAADPFYENLRSEAAVAYGRGDYPRALQLFRLACFGLLDEPVVLGECLVQRSMAEAAVDDPEAFTATFRRILEIEQRFGAYSQAALTPELRQAFEDYLELWISLDELQSTAAFHGVAQRLIAASSDASEAEEIAEPAEEIAEPAEEIAEPAEEPAEQTADAPAEPPTERPLPPAEALVELDAARQLLRARDFSRDDVKEAYPRVRQVADDYPEHVESQYLAGEFAYRLGLWRDGVTYFRRGGEIAAEQPLLLFYFAVVLYETGEVDSAAQVLEQCLPALQHNEVVTRYREKILGEGSS